MQLRSVRRLVVAPLLLVSLQLPGAAPAQADPRAEIRQAQSRINHLQALVESTTKKIEAGTREYQRDQAALAKVRARLIAVNAQLDAQQAVADEGQARVDQLARRMYMHPVDDQLRMALAMDAQQVVGLLRTRGELKQVALSDTEVVHRAEVAQLQLSRKRAEIAKLGQEARRLTALAQQKLEELDQLMTSTSHQLDVAQGALGRARVREAARLSRLAAERAARFRALASRGGAGCHGSSTAGMANGNLDPAVLCRLWRAPGHRLRTDAAKAFARMSQYHLTTQGTPLCVTDSYRSYSEQVDVYRRKPDLAAVPGTSNHGWGRALDLCGGVQTAGTAAYRWMKRNAPQFGWHHPAWAEPSGSKPEAWHWEFGTS
jgi:hypothetical protein